MIGKIIKYYGSIPLQGYQPTPINGHTLPDFVNFFDTCYWDDYQTSLTIEGIQIRYGVNIMLRVKKLKCLD